MVSDSKPPSRHAWTNIKSIGDDCFVTENVGRVRDGRFYGGYLIAQALYCAYQTIPTDFDINSFHSYFVKSGVGNQPIRFRVGRIRDGRNFIFRSVQLLQPELIYHCEFTFRKRPDNADLKITQAQFPNVPTPERVANVNELQSEFRRSGYKSQNAHGVAFPEILRDLEICPCNGMEYLFGPQRPTLKQNIWVRYRPQLNEQTETRVQSCLAIAFMSDIGLTFTGGMPFPHVVFRNISSNDHSGWMHDLNFNPNEFMLFEQECLMHSRGTSLVHGRLWTQSGELIASFSQEAAIEQVPALESMKPNAKL
ncbi:hypothetical protein M3Y98_00449800 [Aphelenchoides besseyi]|nr:hypothetical protein M3Y98_00449800 [Aphelenchoides besseyi]KAI6207380.1 hypothetical protein M3Y96_00003000 [Aphelenchoides besseyi]